MEYLLPILTSIVSGVLVFILQSVIKDNRELKREKDKATENEQKALKEANAKEQSALKEGVLCLLRVKLIEYHAKYTKNGNISSHGLENWLLMYKAYKSLGGNGMIERMKEEVEELHIV